MREHFESSTTHILAKNQNFQKRLHRALDNHIGYLYIQSELNWSIAHGGVYRLLVNTQISSFWAILGNFGSVRGIFSDSRTKNRRKIMKNQLKLKKLNNFSTFFNDFWRNHVF